MKMKTAIVAIAAISMSVGIASADIQYDLSRPFGDAHIVTPSTGGPIVPFDADPSTRPALYQVLWSLDDPAGYMAVPGGDGIANANVYLLDSVVNDGRQGAGGAYSGFYGQLYSGNIAGSAFGDSAVGGNDINNGYLFSRVFENPTIGGGDWYRQDTIAGPTLPPTVDGMGNPQLPVVSALFPSIAGPGNPVSLDRVVPEPGTILLIAIGVGTIFVRRMRRSD
jgi:hypothetical protein